MRIALIEPFSGVAGDMLVGALLHAGARLDAVEAGLRALGLPDLRVVLRPERRGAIAAARFEVLEARDQPERGPAEIEELLARADLPARVRERARAAFDALARAEAAVHGVPVAEVHFHEVGALDALADVVGAALALESLGVDRLYCRSLPFPTGAVLTRHGVLPLPAPATLELLRGRAVHDAGSDEELVTPTGAALVAAWCEPGPPPAFVPLAAGYGAGRRDPPGRPNVCRVVVGEAGDEPWPDALVELACDIDDATPEQLAHLQALLLEAGARDATLQPVSMKKGRPGVRVAVLGETALVPALERLLFAEGGTLGVRRHAVERTELARRHVRVATPWGEVRVKVGELGGETVVASPEFEDCARIARQAGVSLKEVMRAAMAQWRA